MGLKWIGYLRGAEGLPGIPARDLTDDEIEQYGGADALVATGLYERPHEIAVNRPEVTRPQTVRPGKIIKAEHEPEE